MANPEVIIAPDGMEVELHAMSTAGSMAKFRLPAGKIGRAVRHRTVEEIWYILSGDALMWFRNADGTEREFVLTAGISFTIPVGTAFQLNNSGDQEIQAIAVTMPPWPGEDEAVLVTGKWVPSV